VSPVPERPEHGLPPRTGDLLPQHVEAVFLEFLGRHASPDDVALWMNIGSLRALIDGVLDAEEYRARLAERESEARAAASIPYVNCWTPELAGYCRPPGTISDDGVAIVGEQGHLFLYGGTNDNLAMFRGDVPMASDWLDQWCSLVEERNAHASARGLSLCSLVVPDKLAVYSDLLPSGLLGEGARPLNRLMESERLASLLYPGEALRAARSGGETYMVTDSHLTNRGNRLLAELTIEALGAGGGLLDGVERAERTQLVSGDLGTHFHPPVLERRGFLANPSAAEIVADNWGAISAAGGHIGTRRVFRREDAPDRRTVVIFGDSYAFGDEAYPGLSWFLAQAFREVHFVWVPFGWDPDYVERTGAELAVCQTAERFVVRVPRVRVDVASLVGTDDSSPGAHGLETVFDDVPG
jgi:alginate O-acetyltransferase complex protein AlgJ